MIHHDSSLPNDEVPEHFHILSVCLLIVGLIVVSHLSMNNIEISAVGKNYGWNGEGPLSLNQTITVRATIEVSADCHDSGNSGQSSSESSLCLHNTEALMIIEEFWLLVYLGSFLISKTLSDLFLTLEEHINLIKSARILRAE